MGTLEDSANNLQTDVNNRGAAYTALHLWLADSAYAKPSCCVRHTSLSATVVVQLQEVGPSYHTHLQEESSFTNQG